MEGQGWYWSIIVGFITGFLTYVIMNIVRGFSREGDHINSGTISENKQSDNQSNNCTSVIFNCTNKMSASNKKENIQPQKKVEQRHEQDGLANEIEMPTSQKTMEDRELTMKEKFYLFLEKGFCPELEKGVDDPMYKYFGGKGPRNDTGVASTMDNMFCPFKGMAGGEDGEDPNSDTESEANLADLEKDDPLVTEQELKRLEEMLKAGNTNTAKCPFSKPSSGRISTKSANTPEKPLNHQQLTQMIEKSGGECPFKFAMKPDADSEDEADVPKHHIKNGNCPLNKRGTQDQNMIEVMTDTQCMEEGKPDDDISEGCEDPAARSVTLKETLHSIEKKLTIEELEQEEKCREEQMAAIFNLLSNHDDGSGIATSTDLQSQLKLYI